MTRKIRKLKSMFDQGPRPRFMLVEGDDGLHKIVDQHTGDVVGYCNNEDLGMSIVRMMNRVDREYALELEREVFGVDEVE